MNNRTKCITVKNLTKYYSKPLCESIRGLFSSDKDNRAALNNISFGAYKGESIGIVGKNGSGKSTIVNLLCRFYEPTSGRILLDGVDIRAHSQAFLQSHLGYVLQAPHLFSGTIADNIRYGDPTASMERVRWAAEQVSAAPFIDQLPEGYQTQVGEGGNRLSTGQKQLISFARALIANPAIVCAG